MQKAIAKSYYQRRQWHPTPVLLPGKSHGRKSLVGRSPWGREESDMTERLQFHFSLLCIGEGNGKPLQGSCLENPRDGVAQSQTWLKWLSSSSKSYYTFLVLTSLSHVWLFCGPMDCPARLLCPWGSLGKNTWVGCHFLLLHLHSEN